MVEAGVVSVNIIFNSQFRNHLIKKKQFLMTILSRGGKTICWFKNV